MKCERCNSSVELKDATVTAKALSSNGKEITAKFRERYECIQCGGRGTLRVDKEGGWSERRTGCIQKEP